MTLNDDDLPLRSATVAAQSDPSSPFPSSDIEGRESEGGSSAPASRQTKNDSLASRDSCKDAAYHESGDTCQDSARSPSGLCGRPLLWANDGKRPNEILRRLRQELFRRLVRSGCPDPDDVAQKIVVRAIEKNDLLFYMSEEAMWGTLRRVEKRVRLEHHRDVRRFPLLTLDSTGDSEKCVSNNEFDKSAQTSPSAEALMLRELDRSFARRGLERLTPTDQEAIQTWLTHMEMRELCRARGLSAPPPLTGRERTGFFRAVERLQVIVRDLQQAS